MTNIENIIGDIVFLSFKDIGSYKNIGINSLTGHYKIKGIDNLGLWLEHPGLYIIHNEDTNGKPLPESKHTKETILAEFLVVWNNIDVIMHYPGREGYDYPSEFDKKIGFEINT